MAAKPRSIPSELRDRPFTWAEAKKLGVSWNEIQRKLKTGQLERLNRGVYRFSSDDLDEEEQFRIATLRAGKISAVCLVSALAAYGLTDSIPKAVWVLVPAEKRTRLGDVRLFRKRTPLLNIGIVRKKGYAITSLERTIAECLAERKRVGTNIATEALRRALQQRQTTLARVLDIANQLGIAHRIRPFIEALA